MAQKKKKEPEVKEEYTFIAPDFNEREFLEKDLSGTKAVLFTAVFAVLFGAVAYLTTGISVTLGLMLIIVGAFTLRYIFKALPINISTIENKTWIGNGIMFFFLALGIWIILLNPPFGDAIDPQLNDLQIWAGDSQLTNFNNVPLNASVTFNITAMDNGNLNSVQFKLLGDTPQSWNMTIGEDGRWEHTMTFTQTATYNFVITATDDAGNVETLQRSILVV
ncbi:MAG TPA: Ig-like domain-containing protein [Methanomassiliicoccales archaeon]|nr:Ig-like domain-containing protein [Methanomassiliicoccales archaeon]